MVTDKYVIREQNASLVMEQIVQHAPISRATLSANIGLNKATVSDITKKLLEEKIIEEIGIGESSHSGGRKPILLQLNKKAGLSIAIELGYDFISTMVTYLDGEVVFYNKERGTFIKKENVLSHISDIIEKYEKISNLTTYGIVGIGIAIHGIVNKNNILFTPYYDLEKIELYEELTKLYQYPIHIENEANLTAIGESTFSTEFNNLISLSIHSGIGAGIIIDGQLFTGLDGRAGEVGHSILYPDGRTCPCGNKGCLEQYCSDKVLLEQFKELKQLSDVTPDLLAEHYYANDLAVQELIQQHCYNLSKGLNNIMTSFAPKIIYMNSSVIRRVPDILSFIRDNLESSFNKDIVIENSRLGSKASLFGATALNIRNFLNISHLKIINVE
ncbi:MarR family transcriptional regulator [Niallia circulans]|jgi:predicted NBD/HSP70 family sugar kinase|uniref:ROK family protein n=1 Tax=Niallia TaxID=2837506 RepID=UPI000BA6A228|nr:ROK family protein [Niallia circulans]PAD26150.1 MarR family transcriptional regulator [Niallia circulans]PAD86846.1 MarR family transcriptional regulator [Niallia circulans]